MSLELDTEHFISTLNRYIDTSKKAAAEVLNDRARNVAYKAAAATPIETPAAIEASLRKDPKLLARLVSIKLRKGGKQKLQPGEFTAMMDALVKQRQATSRYLRVGWSSIIVALGGSFRGSRAKPVGATRTTHSYAKKANALSLLAELGWSVDEPSNKEAGAVAIAMKALQAGIQGEDKQLAEHMERKLERALK